MSTEPRLPPESGPPLVYAHRGGALLRPENTIEAFDHGLSFGVDGLEFDVHLSRDGVVVVHHDETLERTTNGRGRLRACTADELARLDAGYWFQPDGTHQDHSAPVSTSQHPSAPLSTSQHSSAPVSSSPHTNFPFRGRGIRIPRLREVLRRYDDVHLIIELKGNEPELARRTIAEVRAANAIERVALGAFGWRVLHAARLCESRIRTGAAKEEVRWALYRSWVRWPLWRPPYQEFQVAERFGRTTIVTPRFIDYAHRAGLPVKVWVVNTEADMRRLLAWGADALISDRPDIAVKIVRGIPSP